jgi:hypothetical protein
MKQCKIYNLKEESIQGILKSLKTDGKCSKDYQIISNSLNDYSHKC